MPITATEHHNDVRCVGERVSQEEGESKFGICGLPKRVASMLGRCRRFGLVLEHAAMTKGPRWGSIDVLWVNTCCRKASRQYYDNVISTFHGSHLHHT
eukprot:COSAG05_NODE_48_length_24425_cov_90.438543_3_plen_98_part_00